MKYWAHRGCSQRYPENTQLSFEKAASLRELTGIETDVQRTKDGVLVIIHDERVDRTTEGFGLVKDYTWDELKRLHIFAGQGRPSQRILTLDELLDLLAPRLRDGMLLNLELKNSNIRYEGMEAAVLDLVHEKGLAEQIVYSSFLPKSLALVRSLDADAQIAVLATHASDCLMYKNGGCGATAIHPYWQAIDEAPERLAGLTVRAWMSGHLYPEPPTGTRLDVRPLEAKGITDIMMNEPEMYID